MRDAKLVQGKKRYFEDLEEFHRELMSIYGSLNRQGSVGAWSWSLGEVVVAEAWIHATKPGWWCRQADIR
jgi:hypothetical protein